MGRGVPTLADWVRGTALTKRPAAGRADCETFWAGVTAVRLRYGAPDE